MNQDRDARTVLVTGAGKRIGRQIALTLAGKGYHVAVHYNRSDRDAQDVVNSITSSGGQAVAVGADLSNRQQTRSLIARAAEALGSPIECLVNNASLFENDSVADFTDDQWDQHLNINTLAPLQLIQSLAKGLDQSRKGAIVNIIDQRVWRLNPTFLTYTVSKAALWTLTQTTAQALAPRIRVNAIGPGPVLQSIHQSGDTFADEARHVPLQKGPTLDEIANTVDYLLTAPSVTGQMIALDGGQHLAWKTPDVDL